MTSLAKDLAAGLARRVLDDGLHAAAADRWLGTRGTS